MRLYAVRCTYTAYTADHGGHGTPSGTPATRRPTLPARALLAPRDRWCVPRAALVRRCRHRPSRRRCVRCAQLDGRRGAAEHRVRGSPLQAADFSRRPRVGRRGARWRERWRPSRRSLGTLSSRRATTKAAARTATATCATSPRPSARGRCRSSCGDRLDVWPLREGHRGRAHKVGVHGSHPL